MIYLKRAKAVVHYANYFRCLTRMAHCCFVKNAADSDRIDLSLEYAPKDGTVRTYNANRSKLEPLSNTLSRLGSRIEGQLNRKNKKRKRKEGDELTNTISSDQEMKLSICVMTCDSTKIIDEETPVVDAFTEKHVLVVDNEKVPIIVNPPCCTKIELPEVAMVGFPIFPSIQLEYVDHDHCEYRWKRIKYEDDVAIAEPSSKKKNKTDKPRTVIEATDLSDEIVYTPVISDIDRHLQLTCLPRTGERQGKAGIAVTKFEIKPGPGICPFDHRHLYTQKEAGPDEYDKLVYFSIKLYKLSPCILTFSQTTNFETQSVCQQHFQMIMMKIVESSPNGWKTLVTSNFSFFPQHYQTTSTVDTAKQGLFGKWLTHCRIDFRVILGKEADTVDSTKLQP